MSRDNDQIILISLLGFDKATVNPSFANLSNTESETTTFVTYNRVR